MYNVDIFLYINKLMKYTTNTLNLSHKNIAMVLYIIAILVTTLVANIAIQGITSIFGTGILIIFIAIILEVIKIVLSNVLFFYEYAIKSLPRFTRFLLKLMLGFAFMTTAISLYTYLKNNFDVKLSEYKNLVTVTSFTDDEISVKLNEIKSLETRKDMYNSRLGEISTSISQNVKEINKLNDKEGVYVSLITNLQTNNSKLQIAKSKIYSELEAIDTTISSINYEINKLKLSKTKTTNTNNLKSDISTMIYLSNIFGVGIDTLVSLIIVVIILLIDPVVLILYICAGIIYQSDTEPLHNFDDFEDMTNDNDRQLEKNMSDILPNVNETDLNTFIKQK